MANQKQRFRWVDVKAGNIISFKYKSLRTGKARIHTLLVLNPRVNITLKNGKLKKHLVGIKIEESNKMELQLSKRVIGLLERIGDFKTLDKENNIYKLEILPRFIKSGL